MGERLWTPGGPQEFAHVDPNDNPNRAERRRMKNDLRALRRRAARERDKQAHHAGLPTPAGSIGVWFRERQAYRWLD